MTRMTIRFTGKRIAFGAVAALLGTAVLSTIHAEPAPTGKPPAPAVVTTIAQPPAAPPKPFEVFPTTASLETSRDRQSLIARVTQPDGVTRDVTGEATFTVANP